MNPKDQEKIKFYEEQIRVMKKDLKDRKELEDKKQEYQKLKVEHNPFLRGLKKTGDYLSKKGKDREGQPQKKGKSLQELTDEVMGVNVPQSRDPRPKKKKGKKILGYDPRKEVRL